MGPLEAVKPWQTNQLTGVVRFRDRVFNLVKSGVSDSEPTGEVLKDMHKTIKKVTNDIENMAFNTAISQLMVFSNTLKDLGSNPPRSAIESLVLLLSPIAPHVAEECWSLLGHANSLSAHPWPVYDEALCVDNVVTVAVQVNGKLRGTLEIESAASEEIALDLALKQPSIQKFINDKPFKKVIYVPGKILNLVLAK